MENTVQEQETSSSSLQELLDKYLDGKLLLETYLRKGSGFCNDTIDQIFSCLIKLFSSGRVKGNTMIQFSLGPYIYYSFPACAYFKEIIVATSTNNCLEELEKWRKNEADALDMSHIAEFVCEREGNRETWMEKQSMIRSKMKKALKYNVIKHNPIAPIVLPQVDCLFLTHCIEVHTLTKEGFCSALKNISSLLKPGGALIMIVLKETTFYMFGKFKFPHLCLDEGFLRKAVTDIGYCIEELTVLPRKCEELFDVNDYTAFMMLYARKETEG
ncbi:nicotinamide N-methyltransferase-like [Ambystoma mexicanum]|uniref:nicotinamide N-methyltransferase-like n=1 Tax=Ambystoma mexicanum TaxID=8296 RepID=UPI0037E70268